MLEFVHLSKNNLHALTPLKTFECKCAWNSLPIYHQRKTHFNAHLLNLLLLMGNAACTGVQL